MGRWYYYKKATVERALDLSVFGLRKCGMFKHEQTVIGMKWENRQTGKESQVIIDVNIISEPYTKLTYLDFGRRVQKLNCSINSWLKEGYIYIDS